MDEYLLDTNVIIALWKECPNIINTLIEEKKAKILEEVSIELVVKERSIYNGQYVLSKRFCELLPLVIKIDRSGIKEFYSMIDIKYSRKGNAYYDNTEKLSENDLALLYACYINENLILATEDKYLFNATGSILGQKRVISLMALKEKFEG